MEAAGGGPAIITGWAYTDGSGKGVGKMKAYGWGFVVLDCSPGRQGQEMYRKYGAVPGCEAI